MAALGIEFDTTKHFVPVAEQCGLIVPISVWVLKKACLEAAIWRQRDPTEPPLYVSINISSKHSTPFLLST